ncbi:MAG: Rieske 2Fe-2S domain-containing protein [Inquilinus sp.]|nr:Rieske 2Fe-2S domain-containing protein [Inquilinus sp.]
MEPSHETTQTVGIEGLDRVLRPIAEASGLPNEAYVSAEYAVLERDRVLARGWTCIGTGAQVPAPGDLRPLTLAGLPLLLLRDREGTLRVFHNVCSHRGMELVSQPGKSRGGLRCPYHSWTYGLDGALKATPAIGGPGTRNCEGFDRKRHGLRPVRMAVWFDAVFVDLSGAAPEFEAHIAPLAGRWGDFGRPALHPGGPESRFSIDLACNWKLAVENFCEAYHLPWVHPSLNSYSRLEDHYGIEDDSGFAGQGSRVYSPRLNEEGRGFPPLPGLPDRWHGAAEYIALFPNTLLGIHADHFWVVWLEPLAADRTLEHCEIYYFDAAALGEAFGAERAANARQWQTVFEEDRGVVEGMQRGRASPAFEGGVFSPAMDGPTHCFHKWMARALG